MSARPDYSPRESNILRNQRFAGTAWQTNETPPRKVELLGRAAIDPDVYVVKIDGDDRARWLMACGNNGWDGSIIGDDGIWLRECSA